MLSDGRLKKPLPSAETLLEGRFDRDRAVHAALESGRPKGSVAREFGLTGDEVLAIHAAMEAPCVMLANARYRARKRAEAAEARVANEGRWPPSRIRNILVQEFGIAVDSLGDATVVAEAVSRSEIESVPMSGRKIADAVAAFLEGHGLSLRD